MRNLLIDAYGWLFEQSGFSWREWRELCWYERWNNTSMPSTWTGEW